MIKKKIIIFEDNDTIRNCISCCLKNANFSTLGVSSGKNYQKYINNYKPDLILLDIQMPYVTGLDIAEGLKKKGNKTPIMFISSYAEQLNLQYPYLSKPFSYKELLFKIQTIFQKSYY